MYTNPTFKNESWPSFLNKLFNVTLAKTLSMPSTKEIMIELNNKSFDKINKIFSKNGFKEISRGLHQNGNFDVLYKRFN